MKFCVGTAKCVLTVLSFFFLLVGIAVIVVGSWTYAEYGQFDSKLDSHLVVLPAVILIGAGVFILLLAITGCIGTFKEQKCLLVLFFILMLVVFVGLVSGGVLAYVYHGRIDSTLEKGISDCMDKYKYKNESACTKDIDYIQQNLKCCGSNNYTDWLDEPWHKESGKPYPSSCCFNKTCDYTLHAANDTNLYQEGCHAKLVKDFKQNLGIVAGVAAAFVVIQLIGMVFSCVLLCKKRSEVPYVGLGDNGGMRV